MFTRFEYRSLPSRSPPLPVTAAEEERDIPNCPTCTGLARQRWYHWSTHLASSIALILLLALHFNPHRLAVTCWNMHNYYCTPLSRLLHLFTPLLELIPRQHRSTLQLYSTGTLQLATTGPSGTIRPSKGRPPLPSRKPGIPSCNTA
jgi:hypothetical protein